MMSQEIVLHIGAPKCGSSSIQTLLSQSARIEDQKLKRNFRYFVIDGTGAIQFDGLLSHRMRGDGVQYLSSVPLEMIPDKFISSMQQILETIDVGDVPILSCEGWAKEAGHFRTLDPFAQLGLKVHVILFVRPPIDWINSGWWQWGVWSGTGLDEWVDSGLAVVDWLAQAQEWEDIPGVENVEVLSISDGVIPQFTDALQLSGNYAEITANAASPPALIDYLLRNKRFGRTTHNRVVEERIKDILGPGKHKAPFVIRKDLQAKIIENTAEQNYKLAAFISNAEKRKMFLEDQRYFDHSTYSHLPISDVRDFAGAAEYDDLIGLLLERLLKIEQTGLPSVFHPNDFDPERYLELNPDVRKAGEDAYSHYVNYGIVEGRRYK